jgi:hypothetical protein
MDLWRDSDIVIFLATCLPLPFIQDFCILGKDCVDGTFCTTGAHVSGRFLQSCPTASTSCGPGGRQELEPSRFTLSSLACDVLFIGSGYCVEAKL